MPQLTYTMPEVWLQMGNTNVRPPQTCWWTHPVAVWALSRDLGIMVSPGNTTLVMNQSTQCSSPHCTGCSPSWEELGSTWFNRRSEWGRWTMSDNDKQLLTFFVQHTQTDRALSHWIRSSSHKSVAFLISNLKGGLNELLNHSLMQLQCLQCLLQVGCRAFTAACNRESKNEKPHLITQTPLRA